MLPGELVVCGCGYLARTHDRCYYLVLTYNRYDYLARTHDRCYLAWK